MNKIDETQLRDGYVLKTYTDESIKNVFDLINKIQGSIAIEKITAEEGVELDMQSYNGLTYTVEEFKNAYPLIKHTGKELSYSIEGLYNGAPVKVGIGEGDNIVTLVTNVSSIELDDLVQGVKPETLTF